MTVKTDNKTRVKTWLAVLCNLLIVAFTAYSMTRFFTVGGSGNMAVLNARCFQYFTTDSNLLAALSSLLLIIAQFGFLLRGRPIPAPLVVLKLVGTAAVTLTFFTVFCFLGFLYGFQSMIAGTNLFMHLISPLLAMVSFVLLETVPPLRFRNVFLGLLPTLAYGVVYMVMVVGLRRWMDFYGLNMGGRWLMSSVLMLAATLVITIVLWALRRAAAGKRPESDIS